MFKKLMQEEKGYGTVELLVLVAALGILATGLMMALRENLLKEDGGVVSGLNTKINGIISSWEIPEANPGS